MTDAKGNAVAGLMQDGVERLEDGVPKPVTNLFSLVATLDAPLTAAAEAAVQRLPQKYIF